MRRLPILVPLALLGACATVPENPGPLWILGATARALAGAPPTPRDYYNEPVKVSDTLKFTAITAGAEHTCALTVDGDTYCWGSSEHAQLGGAALTQACRNGTIACSATPVRVEGAPRFMDIAASIWGTCGLDRSGAAHCWGYGLGGRRDDGLPAGSAVPLAVPGGHAFASLQSSSAGTRTCGLTPQGEAWCWGPNIDGASAGGAAAAFSGPERVPTATRFEAISHGAGHGCGIDASRKVYCWGDNQFGQLGAGVSALAGGMAASASPIEVRGGLRLDVAAAGPSYTCGIDTGRSVYCFGLGFPLDANGGTADRQTPAHGALPLEVDVPQARYTALAGSTTQACLLSTDGALFCISTAPTVRPFARPAERVASDEPFVAFAVGGGHACAIGEDALAYCWGSSNVGQVGR